MIDALIAGRMYGQAQQRQGQAASHYVTCKLRVALAGGDTIFCNVIAFDDTLQAALLALGDGDAVSVSGALTPKIWEDKQGNTRPAVDLIAHAILTVYDVQKKRDALQVDDLN
ncbi:single-stranded DNA-binding protein [Undibacterium sp. Jales W-56]|uniref:single-stranded DNA-binding protein n=1 Tax=Undibacterium sp. Jales W-56 TaxID=2897325 RepID=UPI0021D14C65|nr:single-stranded DNA-binding protein [Undibacterium sp. Jales W-56]MCU6435628.1 single-stranded DNA-binding protein [Undibacterium sp. Jales W-56]